MDSFNLTNMKGGWFVGKFLPTAYSTDNCEVCYKQYNQGFLDQKHYHMIATEITLVISGYVRFNEKFYARGDIIVVKPGEVVEFEAISDAETIVVKTPGVLNDKYFAQ